jgi:hypothetical protein
MLSALGTPGTLLMRLARCPTSIRSSRSIANEAKDIALLQSHGPSNAKHGDAVPRRGLPPEAFTGVRGFAGLSACDVAVHLHPSLFAEFRIYANTNTVRHGVRP